MKVFQIIKCGNGQSHFYHNAWLDSSTEDPLRAMFIRFFGRRKAVFPPGDTQGRGDQHQGEARGEQVTVILSKYLKTIFFAD